MALALPTTDDPPVAADVLGSFGVTPADVTAATSSDGSLEAALADAFATDRDRTAVLRRTIARSDRGIACDARYRTAALERALTGVFESVGWSLAVERTGDGLGLTATDPRGRSRETTVTYPETPLGTDNLPAVLWTITEDLFAGTDARFVLLSAGVDRWRAALVDESALERLRESYGPRIDAFDRPLLPEYGLGAYVPATSAGATGGSDDGPWPPWARERREHRTEPPAGSVDALIEEAEPATGATATDSSDGATARASSVDGFELRGTPSVSRRGEGPDERAEAGAAETGGAGRSSKTGDSRAGDRSTAVDESGTDSDGFGTLSGTSERTRIDDDSFGTDIEGASAPDRYRALGAALDAGGDVSVRGLLEDDDFLPELPAADPDTVRIEYADGCDPVDPSEAAAVAEEDGFEWVDAGDLETTRLAGE
ncbi:hypothetical protein C478_04834 [Natrinema thermotolerans DSM 11552]|nr:hypothetical protein C478_04834 [Natrinema thermotolerans DSM 11552]